MVERVNGQILDVLLLIEFPDGLHVKFKKKKSQYNMHMCACLVILEHGRSTIYRTVNVSFREGRQGWGEGRRVLAS